MKSSGVLRKSIVKPETETITNDILKIVSTKQVKPIHKIRQRPELLRTFDSSHILCEKHKRSRKRIWQKFENKCPCGSLVDKNPSQSIAKKLQRLPWMCQNYRWGCREVKVDVKTLETHHGECKFRKVICPLAVEFCPREVDDGELICEGKKIFFKDIFDHLNTVHKDDWNEINGESNKWIQSINIEGNLSNGHFWFPSKLTSTNGDVFGLVARVKGYSGYSTLTY